MNTFNWKEFLICVGISAVLLTFAAVFPTDGGIHQAAYGQQPSGLVLNPQSQPLHRIFVSDSGKTVIDGNEIIGFWVGDESVLDIHIHCHDSSNWRIDFTKSNWDKLCAILKSREK